MVIGSSKTPKSRDSTCCSEDQKDALMAGAARYSAVFDMLSNPTEVNISRIS
jgi:hypothetical protein